MVTVDDLTALRGIASQSYWVCETTRDIICGSDDDVWLQGKIPTLTNKLEDYQQAFSDSLGPALNTIEQAVAIENLPPIVVGNHESQTATGEARLLMARYYLRISSGDAADVREAMATLPEVDYAAAQKRVREEWNAAVRLLNGTSLPAYNIAAVDLIWYQDIADIAGVAKKTVQTRASEWKKNCIGIKDGCSYGLIKPFLMAAWDVFPADYDAMRQILSLKQRDLM